MWVCEDEVFSGTHVSFIVQNLDLTRVAEFDHRSDRDHKLSARLQVQPHIVALGHQEIYSLIIGIEQTF